MILMFMFMFSNSGRKSTIENNVAVTTKADIGRPSKGISDSMRKAIHARRSSYRPTPVKNSLISDRLAAPEEDVAIEVAEKPSRYFTKRYCIDSDQRFESYFNY